MGMKTRILNYWFHREMIPYEGVLLVGCHLISLLRLQLYFIETMVGPQKIEQFELRIGRPENKHAFIIQNCLSYFFIIFGLFMLFLIMHQVFAFSQALLFLLMGKTG